MQFLDRCKKKIEPSFCFALHWVKKIYMRIHMVKHGYVLSYTVIHLRLCMVPYDRIWLQYTNMVLYHMALCIYIYIYMYNNYVIYVWEQMKISRKERMNHDIMMSSEKHNQPN